MRVKLYHLKNEPNWEDQGTGVIHLHFMDSDGSLSEPLTMSEAKDWIDIHPEGSNIALSIESESEDESILLQHRIVSSLDYELQGDTIIAWYEHEWKEDVAVSFQEEDSCQEIWSVIQKVKGKRNEGSNTSEDDNNEIASSSEKTFMSDDCSGSSYNNYSTIPPPSTQKLSDTIAYLNSLRYFERESLAQYIISDDHRYLRKLFQTFQSCENNKQLESLKQISQILIILMNLNIQFLLEAFVSDSFIQDFIGCLEYHPDSRPDNDFHCFRDYLNNTHFIQVIPIVDETVTQKMIENFRLDFIKDVVLLRYLEDPASQGISTMVFFNQVQIISSLASNSSFISLLISKIQQAGEDLDALSCTDRIPGNEMYDAIVLNSNKSLGLLRELIRIGNLVHLQADIFTPLVSQGLLEVLVSCISSFCPIEEEFAWIGFVECLRALLVHKRDSVESLIMSDTSSTGLVFRLSSIMCIHPSSRGITIGNGMLSQISELLTLLLEPQGLMLDEKQQYSDAYFTNVIPNLMKGCIDRLGTSWSRFYSLDLLISFLSIFPDRTGQYLFQNRLLTQVVKLLDDFSNDVNMVLCSIRFVRACILTKDSAFIEEIVQNSLLVYIMRLFFRNGSQYNMKNSACLQLLELVHSENIKPIVNQFNELYYEQCRSISYVATFSKLHDLYVSNSSEAENFLTRPVFEDVSIPGTPDTDAMDLENDRYFSAEIGEDSGTLFPGDSLVHQGEHPVMEFITRMDFGNQNRDEDSSMFSLRAKSGNSLNENSLTKYSQESPDLDEHVDKRMKVSSERSL